MSENIARLRSSLQGMNLLENKFQTTTGSINIKIGGKHQIHWGGKLSDSFKRERV